jgi:ABC-type Fe3+/spermidine/putrescine transport system ATPase subunit
MMLRLENIDKKMGNFSLNAISIDIREGEYYVLLGRSGAGKTQLLELIAGLTDPDSGTIWLDDEDITRKKIQDRKIGLLFQDYAVFPHMTVYGNIAYSLHGRHIDKDTIKNRVSGIAVGMKIGDLLNRYTTELSGGELQRVALARTLITSPRLLLLDEPLASIDASIKDDLKRMLRQLNKDGQTIIHVTHDYSEAICLASRVGVIHSGRIIQEGTPDQVFGKPVNKFVARYAGIKNFYRVHLVSEAKSSHAHSDGNMVFELPDGDYPSEGLVIINGNEINIHPAEPQGFANTFRGRVTEIIPSERGMEITLDAGERFYIDVSSRDFRNMNLSEGSDAWISIPPQSCIVLRGSN